MDIIADILILGGCLLAVVALVAVAAVRLGLPEATLLSVAGIAIGGGYFMLASLAPHLVQQILTPLVAPSLPAEVYLWLFLPPLLFQAALTVDVRALLADAAPILLLAIVAVFVATGVIGVAAAAVTSYGLVACLLLGAILATTDPAAVIAIFRDVGAPARLIRLVEGESLFNDAAAIAIVGILLAMLTGGLADASLTGGLQTLALSFVGGVGLGLLVGRLVAFLLPLLDDLPIAEAALTLAVPYPLYLFADQVFQLSGVIAVVSAGLVISNLGRTRLAPRNWEHLQIIWEQIAVLAGAVIFLLAAVRVPQILIGVGLRDLLLIVVIILAAFAARLMVLFGLLPLLSWAKLGQPVSGAYKLAIAWGGLRGADTVVLALAAAESRLVPPEIRQFILVTTSGFVLFSLLVNGPTLRWVIRRLRLDRLSPQEEALEQQAIRLSTNEVEATTRRIAGTFHIAASIADEVQQEYRREMNRGAVTLDLDIALTERDRLTIGLVTLAAREREFILEYGNGVISIRNLDAMRRNTGDMIDLARSEGRIGYARTARRILDLPLSYRIAAALWRHLGIRRPLAVVLADRFELLICRRAVLERLLAFNGASLTPLLGARIADTLNSILQIRIASVDTAVGEMRQEFPVYTVKLERRLLMLFALRRGRHAIEAMAGDNVVSLEVYDRIRKTLERTWKAALKRPTLRPPS